MATKNLEKIITKELEIAPVCDLSINSLQINSDNLELSNTSTFDCCVFNCLSFDIIAAFNFNASAKKSISFGFSGIKLNASGILSEYSEKGTNSTTFYSIILNSSKSDGDNFVFMSISDLCLSNSFKTNSGEYKSWSEESNFNSKDPFQKKENNLLVSITILIYTIPCDLRYLSLDCLANSPNLSASSSVNSESSNFDSMNSANSSLCKIFKAAFLNTTDQSISGCASISNLRSSGRDI